MFLLVATSSYSQDKIAVYKSRADKTIAAYFDKSLIPKVRCTDVVVNGVDSNMAYYGQYQSSKNRRDKLSTVEFYYSYFSNVLNYGFKFYIAVDRNKKIQADSTMFMNIPTCIAKNFNCKFLTKDSALKIAINDSISYPQNLDIDFIKNYRNENYFWFVIGRPIEKRTKRRPARKRSSGSYKQERIINALTGEIIPHNDYFEH